MNEVKITAAAKKRFADFGGAELERNELGALVEMYRIERELREYEIRLHSAYEDTELGLRKQICENFTGVRLSDLRMTQTGWGSLCARMEMLFRTYHVQMRECESVATEALILYRRYLIGYIEDVQSWFDPIWLRTQEAFDARLNAA